jgi:hypothetical protein
MRNVSDENFIKNQNPHFVFNNLFFQKPFRLLGNLEKKNIVEPGRPQMTIQHGACALHAG